MFPPKEIAQNLLLRSSTVARFARTRHRTGVLGDPDAAVAILDDLTASLDGTSLDGADVLELGPGRGIELLRAAAQRGANCSAFDVIRYLDEQEADSLGIDYRTDPHGRLPWPAASFDVVWSYSVLEHVHEPGDTLQEVRRVLRSGGRHVAMIDLETHYGGRKQPNRMYEFLRYPSWLWTLMTSHRSSYVNRVRLSGWRELFRDAGFEITYESPVLADQAVEEFRSVPYLRGLSDEDLLTRRVLISSVAVG
jgi:SAM-dependent methyltransferase